LAAGGDIHSNYLVMLIDRGIKNKKRMINTESARRHYAIYKQVKFIQILSLVCYVCITFFERPAWCINNPEITCPSHCDTSCDFKEGIYANSGTPKLEPLATHIIEVVLLLTLLWFTYWKRFYKHPNRVSRIFEWIQLGLTLVSLLDIILSEALYPTYKYPIVAAFIRPILLVLLVRSIRETWRRFGYVIIDSAHMVLFLACFILYFAWLGQRIFKGSLEGVQNYDGYFDSCFYLLVLLTTANFPNYMLPAYKENRWNCLFFIIFLIVALFLLMNMLLAIFYSNYKKRYEETISKFVVGRNEYLD